MILIAAELLRGVRPRPAALAVAAAVVLLAVLSGTSYLNQSAKSYDATSDLIGADLAALELARDIVQPGFILRNQIAGTGYVHVTADDYLRAADAHGSPADTPEELAAAPELARVAADRVSAAALGLAVLPAGKLGSGCARTALDTGPVEVELPPGGAVVERLRPGRRPTCAWRASRPRTTRSGRARSRATSGRCSSSRATARRSRGACWPPGAGRSTSAR